MLHNIFVVGQQSQESMVDQKVPIPSHYPVAMKMTWIWENASPSLEKVGGTSRAPKPIQRLSCLCCPFLHGIKSHLFSVDCEHISLFINLFMHPSGKNFRKETAFFLGELF